MDNFYSQLNERIIRVYESVSRVENTMNENRALNLTITEIHLMEKIHQNPGLNVRDLANLQGVTTATVTVAVQKLTAKGYVTKTKSKRDLREVELGLTKEGEKVVRMHNIFHIKMARAMASRLTEEELHIFYKGLEKMDAYLEEFLNKKQDKKDER